MFTHPELSSQVAQASFRDLQARAAQRHLLAQARSVSSAKRPARLRLSQTMRAAARLVASGQSRPTPAVSPQRSQ
jgi:hypothetical protein